MRDKGVLIDTSAWILFFRGDETVEENITDLLREEKAHTTELVVLELLRGARTKREYRLLYDDLRALPSAVLTKLVWNHAFELAFTLRQSGINVPIVDTLVASLAEAHGLSLLHRDRHYSLMAAHAKLDLIEV